MFSLSFTAFQIRCYATQQLKDRRLYLIRLDQTNTEDTNGVFTCFGQGKGGGQRLRGDETGLEENVVVRREDDQPQVHVTGDAGIAEIKGVACCSVEGKAQVTLP